MVFTWFQIWWSVNVFELVGSPDVFVRPWGLFMSEQMKPYDWTLTGSEMPAFFTPAMWTYFGLAVFGLLFSLFVKDKVINVWKIKTTLPQLIIGLVGFSYIVVVATAVIMIAVRAQDFYNGALSGTILVALSPGLQSQVTMGLEQGYYLACIAGPVLLVLSLLRNIIIGKKLNA
jgi:hypothetical protein